MTTTDDLIKEVREVNYKERIIEIIITIMVGIIIGYAFGRWH